MQSSSQIITTNKPTPSFFTGQMHFLLPNQQCQSTEGINITFHGLACPKFSWGLPTLSLTTNSSWLHWGRVAMPLISPLMPVPQTGRTSRLQNNLPQPFPKFVRMNVMWSITLSNIMENVRLYNKKYEKNYYSVHYN